MNKNGKIKQNKKSWCPFKVGWKFAGSFQKFDHFFYRKKNGKNQESKSAVTSFVILCWNIKCVACLGLSNKTNWLHVYACAYFPSVFPFIHPFNSFYFRFVLITKFQHDCKLHDRARSILKWTRIMYTKFCLFSHCRFLNFQFYFIYVFFSISCPFPFSSIPLRVLYVFFCSIDREEKNRLLQNFRVWCQIYFFFLFCLLSTFLCWRIQSIGGDGVFCCYYCSKNISIDSWKSLSIKMMSSCSFYSFIHSIIRFALWFCHIIKSPKGGQCFFLRCNSEKRSSSLTPICSLSPSFSAARLLFCLKSHIHFCGAEWRGFDLILSIMHDHYN